MNYTVTVGQILKPRGLKGEVKAQFFLDEPHTFEYCFIDGKKYKILNANFHGGFTFFTFEGVDTVEQAEKLRNKSIEVERSEVTLAEDEVLASDLIDFAVVDTEGNHLGVLQAIENYGASDIFDCGTFSFPNEDAFVVETNMAEKKIVIHSEMLD